MLMHFLLNRSFALPQQQQQGNPKSAFQYGTCQDESRAVWQSVGDTPERLMCAQQIAQTLSTCLHGGMQLCAQSQLLLLALVCSTEVSSSPRMHSSLGVGLQARPLRPMTPNLRHTLLSARIPTLSESAASSSL